MASRSAASASMCRALTSERDAELDVKIRVVGRQGQRVPKRLGRLDVQAPALTGPARDRRAGAHRRGRVEWRLRRPWPPRSTCPDVLDVVASPRCASSRSGRYVAASRNAASASGYFPCRSRTMPRRQSQKPLLGSRRDRSRIGRPAASPSRFIPLENAAQAPVQVGIAGCELERFAIGLRRFGPTCDAGAGTSPRCTRARSERGCRRTASRNAVAASS
jgi:hypothetical protein